MHAINDRLHCPPGGMYDHSLMVLNRCCNHWNMPHMLALCCSCHKVENPPPASKLYTHITAYHSECGRNSHRQRLEDVHPMKELRVLRRAYTWQFEYLPYTSGSKKRIEVDPSVCRSISFVPVVEMYTGQYQGKSPLQRLCDTSSSWFRYRHEPIDDTSHHSTDVTRL